MAGYAEVKSAVMPIVSARKAAMRCNLRLLIIPGFPENIPRSVIKQLR